MRNEKGQFVKGNIPANKTHGMPKTKFYRIWEHFLTRCNNSNDKSYKDYGRRGIKVCKEWFKFENFKNEMYEKYLEHIKEFGEKQTTIDRIDNNGNYCKKNCRWATYKEQNRNRRDNRLITYQGKTMCLSAWAEELDIKMKTLWDRMNTGWSVEKTFTTPVKVCNNKLTKFKRT